MSVGEIIVGASTWKLIEDAVVFDVVHLVEDNKNRPTTFIQCFPQHIVNGGTGVTRRGDLIGFTAEFVDEAGGYLITAREPVTVEHFDGKLNVIVAGCVLDKVVEEESRARCLPDTSLSVEEDVVRLLSVDNGLESSFVSVELFVTAHEFVRLVILSKGITIPVDIGVRFEHPHWPVTLFS
jgi:hypothetical protein